MRRIQLLFSEDGVAVSSSPDHRLWKGEELEEVRSLLFFTVLLASRQAFVSLLYCFSDTRLRAGEMLIVDKLFRWTFAH